MAVTLAQFQEWRDRLAEAKWNGILMVQDSSGELVKYRSHTELSAALASLDAEIRNLTGGHRPSTVQFQTSKGL
ncbi:phage head-tail joining protein [Paracoccus sp. p1-h21]|uniref:phage head-tail joining protein n=1 Tax=Paracoccus sp. p1-h21 TaxID=3366951 RepID=UPI00379729DE